MAIEILTYQNATESSLTWDQLPVETKSQMAEVYKEAFAGNPWKEAYICQKCGRFLGNPFCPTCGEPTIQEAYPIDWLVEEYFPQMLAEFTPGMLGLASEINAVVGFTTGGFVELSDLISKKYKSENPESILNSVCSSFKVSSKDSVFYDNETCVLPTSQRQKLGKLLSQTRIETAQNMGAVVVCGRTINIPWLNLKQKQFTQSGYTFSYLVPNGDTYQVEGNPRYFYLAKRLNSDDRINT